MMVLHVYRAKLKYNFINTKQTTTKKGQWPTYETILYL